MQDIRNIMFSNEELLSAFGAYARKTPGFLPEGTLVSCTAVDRPGSDCEVIIKLQMKYGTRAKEIELICRGVDVLQPLVLFCLENNIMLPRYGRKAFAVVDSKAVLVTDLNLEFDLAFEEAPMTTEYLSQITVANDLPTGVKALM